jgi:hypothetical protein
MQVLAHWWPVTHDFGLIRLDVGTVVPMRTKQYEDSGQTVSTDWLSGSLGECFSLLEPLSPAPTKELFLSAGAGWTVYYSNGARGSDPFLPMHKLSRALGVTALRACATRAGAKYAAVILEVYDTPQAGGNKYGRRRSIAAANDGGRWVFEQSGEPFDFEDTACYGARKKADRFTREMLLSYLDALGAPRLTDETLQPGGQCKGALLKRPDHAHLPKYSLEEAKAL